MIDLIVIALQEAFTLFEGDYDEDDFELDGLNYAYHCGEAAGIAAAAGVFGVKALEMCDDISDAYEDLDIDLMRYILSEASERSDSNNEHYARTRDPEIFALEYGAALGEALRAKEEGDTERYALMIGFTVGLMFRHQDPDEGDSGPSEVRARIISGYETDSDELLQQAHGTLGFAARMSDPMGFIGKEAAAREYEEHVRTMRWIQNFGLREARATNEGAFIPNSLSINYQLTQQGSEEDSIESGEDAGLGQQYFEQAVAKMRSGAYQEAIADFDRAIEIDPKNMGSYSNRGHCKESIGDYDGAILDWELAIELNPNDFGQYVNRAVTREAIGDYAGVIDDCTRAIELDPTYNIAHTLRGHARSEMGDYEGAIIDYSRGIELGSASAAAFDERGFAKSRLGNYDEAIIDFNRAIELQPSSAEYYLNCGTAKANAKDYPGAIADLTRATELDPDVARANDKKGGV